MFNLFNRTAEEVEARAYCQAIGIDPDAPVKGWLSESGAGWVMPRVEHVRPRWQWYVARPGADRSFSVSR